MHKIQVTYYILPMHIFTFRITIIPVICGKLCHKAYAGKIVLKLKTSQFILKKLVTVVKIKQLSVVIIQELYDENCCLK